MDLYFTSAAGKKPKKICEAKTNLSASLAIYQHLVVSKELFPTSDTQFYRADKLG
jgi:hypothetical protein